MKNTLIIILLFAIFSYQSAVEGVTEAIIVATDKGIPIMLPPKLEQDNIEIKQRNVFSVLINANDMLLVEEE
jgi:hypothetical protein